MSTEREVFKLKDRLEKLEDVVLKLAELVQGLRHRTKVLEEAGHDPR